MDFCADLATLLADVLGLDSPPIAITFVPQVPSSVPRFEGEVPSACSFWRRAEAGTFYAEAPAHLGCLVGAHVMGFEEAAGKGPELLEVVGQMVDADYLHYDEVPHIPTVAGSASGIVYGPLAQAPAAPDAVLLWLTPYQAMLLREATGAGRWSPEAGPSTFGRPSCAAIPTALQQGEATLSLGCAGMRIFADVAEGKMLGVVPRAALPSLPDGLERARRSNQTMRQRYQAQRAAYAPSQRVGQSSA